MSKTNSKNRRGSLQTKLLLTTAIILVIFTLLLSILSTQFIRYSTTEALKQSMQQTATIAADRVSDYLGQRTALVQSVANRVGALYAPYLTADYAEVDIAFLEAQMRDMAAAYGFDLLFAIDAQGYARTANHGNLAMLAPAYYTSIVQQDKELYMSDIVDDSGILGGSVINISVPIMDSGGARIGVLVAKLDASVISELAAGINIGENGSTFVMNNQGQCIAHKDPEMRFGGTAYTEYRDNPEYASLNKLWDKMRDNTSGFEEYDYDGRRLAAYDTISGSDNWTLAVTAAEDEFMKTADVAVIATICASLLFLIIAFMVLAGYIRPLARRIAAVTNRLERLSKGDLEDDVVPDDSRDEIGRLTYATAVLVQDLNRMIAEIGESLSAMAEGRIHAELTGEYSGDFLKLKVVVERNLSRLGELVEQISRTAEEVSHGSMQIADGASGLARGAAEQAGSVEELYTTVTALSAQAKEISDPQVRYLDESEHIPSDEAETARIEAAPTLIDKLSAAIENIRDRLTEIRKISAAIEGIAAETGMLALNASVEATHAGEYGRGFAVIAADVRELSEKCRQESRNADAQIDSIMRAMSRTGQVLSFTTDSVAQMTRSLSQVEATLSQISSVIEDTAATAEESAASSEELSAQAEVLKELASAFTYETQQ